MAKDRSALRAGIMMVISLALIVGVIIAIKGLAHFTDPKVTRVVAFHLKTDIGGLQVGNEVRVGGFKVGEVERIELRRDEDPKRPPYYLLVAFTIPKKYSIREDAEIRIGGTLTGTSWLNIEALGVGKELTETAALEGKGSATAELLAKLQAIEPKVTGILAQVNDKTIPMVNATVEKFGKTADAATQTIADVRASYKPIVDRYNAVADKAVAMMESIRAVFGDTNEDFRVTIANVRKATTAFAEKLPGMLAKVDGTLSKVDTAVDTVNKTLDDLKATAAGAKEVMVGNKSKIDGMIDSVKKAGDNLKNATAEVRRSPWRLLYKPGPGEIENLNLYDSARQFAEGANDLNDAAAALRDAIKGGQGTEANLKPLVEKLEKSFGEFKKVEQKLWTDVKE